MQYRSESGGVLTVDEHDPRWDAYRSRLDANPSWHRVEPAPAPAPRRRPAPRAPRAPQED